MATVTNQKKQSSTGYSYKPGQLYKDTFDGILAGDIEGVKKRLGNSNEVTLKDIESVSDVDPNMLEMYYKNTFSIVNEVIISLQSIIQQATKDAAHLDGESAIRNLLTLLSKEPMMLKALKAAGRTDFWVANLQYFVQAISNWDKTDEKAWLDIYDIYCYQFKQIITKWGEENYAVEVIPLYANRLWAWIQVDGEILGL